jgi:Zn-dependent protease with chaperone function
VKRLIYLLCVLLAVPALGWVVASVIEHWNDVGATCTLSFRPHCNQLGEAVELLRNVSAVVGGAGLLLPLLFWAASLLIGGNRRWLAIVFPGLVRFSLVALSVIVLAQVAILLFAAYLGSSFAAASVPGFLPALIGFGGLLVGLVLFKHALTMGRKLQSHVAGRLLEGQAHAQVHDIVASVARRLGARPPDNIVVGLDPTFFATSADVLLLGHPQPLQGETLFLSLPLCRLLTLEEMTAIIGHELAHFRGEDTLYSLRFAPVYVGLMSAFYSMARARHWGLRLAAIPATALLAFMLDVFSRNESQIQRNREIEADHAATEVASAEAFGLALMKVAAFAPLWGVCVRESIDRLRKGLATKNLSIAFAQYIQNDLDKEELATRIDDMMRTRIAHPTDSHPSVAERLAAIGGGIPQYDAGTLLAAVDGSVAALGDVDEIETELTAQWHDFLIKAGLTFKPSA